MHASQPFSRWERAGPYRMSIVIWYNDLQLGVGLHRNQRETPQTGETVALEWQVFTVGIAALLLRLIAGGVRPERLKQMTRPRVGDDPPATPLVDKTDQS